MKNLQYVLVLATLAMSGLVGNAAAAPALPVGMAPIPSFSCPANWALGVRIKQLPPMWAPVGVAPSVAATPTKALVGGAGRADCYYSASGGMLSLRTAMPQGKCSVDGNTVTCSASVTCPDNIQLVPKFDPAGMQGWTGYDGEAVPAKPTSGALVGPGIVCTYTATAGALTSRAFHAIPPDKTNCTVSGLGFFCK